MIEVMVAASATVIIAVGSLGYQYYSVKHSRAAAAQTTAARIGQLLIEDWKSNNGDTYDPSILGLGFMIIDSGEYGQYYITLDRQTFYIMLISGDVDEDTVAGVKLRQINVRIRWRNDYNRGPIATDDPEVSMNTYVRTDED